MDRLVAFGCSNTYGQGLEDCYWEDYEPNNETEKFYPSKLAWPQLVADKLEISCHNASICGASNKLLMHQIISFPFLETDTVVIMWTHLDRYSLLRNDISDYRYWADESNYKHRTIGPWNKNVRDKNYYKFIYDEDDHRIMSNHYINYTNLHLEKLNISVLHTTCIDTRHNSNVLHPLIFDVQHEELRHKYPKSLDQSHPGPEAHQEIANRIYKRMTQ